MRRKLIMILTIAACIVTFAFAGSHFVFAADSDADGIDDSSDYCVGSGAYDMDRDGLCDGDDNCPYVSNPDQEDTDGDGSGDVCMNGISKYENGVGVFQGSYEEIGRQVANKYKDIIMYVGNLFTIGVPPQTAQDYYDSIEDIIPDSIKEYMKGMALGLTEVTPLSYDTAWDIVVVEGLFTEMVNVPSADDSQRDVLGCTAFGVSSSAGTYLAHNTDNAENTEGNGVALYIVPDNGDNAYLHFTAPIFVDVMLGLNDKGLGVTYNVGSPNSNAATGLPPNYMVRHVMEKASNLDEAVDYFENFLDEGNNFGYSGAIYLVVDFNNKTMAKIQVKSQGVKITYGEELKPGVTYVATTNHFDEDFSGESDYYYESSFKRYERLMELLNTTETFDLDACWSIVSDHGDGEANNNTISRDGPSTVTTITNIFTGDGSYYTLSRPHEYLETYGSPQYESLCEKVDCSTATQTETCAAAELLGAGSPKLETLRVFRDAVLAKSAAGRIMIEFYYNNGETIAAVLKKSPVIKGTAKKALESLLPIIELVIKK